MEIRRSHTERHTSVLGFTKIADTDGREATKSPAYAVVAISVKVSGSTCIYGKLGSLNNWANSVRLTVNTDETDFVLCTGKYQSLA